jgi:hypothetical protein
MAALFLFLCTALAAPQETGDVTTLSTRGEVDLTDQGVAFVELSAPRDDWYTHEVFELTLRFGFELEFLEEAMIQPFRQELDVPVQVRAPLFQELVGEEGDLRIVLGEDLARVVRVADRENAGRSYAVFELRRSHAVDRPGALVLPRPVLRFAHATRFREDLISGRVPEDRVDAFVTGSGVSLAIRPLPEQGRPPDFSGAVGRIEARAVVEPRDLEAGESLKLTLLIEGPGGASFRTPPLLEGLLSGLRVYGRTLGTHARGPSVSYDLVPAGEEVKEVPAVELSYFDTEEGGYRTARTRPVPILVRRAPEPIVAAQDAPAPEPEVDVAGPTAPEDEPGPRPVVIGGVAFAALVLVALLLRLLRRDASERRPDRARLARVHAAVEAYRREAADEETDAGHALSGFVAACLDCPPAAVIAPDLAQRLEAEDVPAELAQRTATLLEGLVGARYGGRTSARAADVDALIEELSRSLLAQ